jgi:membrane-bound metal-dependent hydrolase YbcI (DUF457 family)
MFLGHHAAALAAKRIAPRTSLGTLIAAATLIDLIWPILLLLGVEHVRIAPGNTRLTPLDFYDYPITHSLAAVLIWSVLFGGAYWLVRRDRRGGFVVAAAVLSHWVLDWVTHRPDLPLWPGGPKAGLGMWQSVPLTVLVESALFIGGVAAYVRTTRARDRIGSIGFWSLIAFLGVIYVANVTSPPPPSWQIVAWGALAAWIFVPWAALADRHRDRHRT